MSPRLAPLLAVLAVVLPGVASGAVRCELATTSKVAGACIDPKALKGQTLRLPANVTRIGDDGLALCTPTNVSKLSSDIVYIIDNSASMSSWGFWINPADGDTSWFINDCANSTLGKAGTKVVLRRRHHGGKTGADSVQWDTLVRMDGPTSPGVLDRQCWESNDPYDMRDQAVRVALGYQAAFDPTSMAGVIYFNSAVKQRFQMRTLAPRGLQGLVDSTGRYPAASGTQWAPPFDTALRWLAATPATGRSKAIILVSDGEPTDAAKYTALLGKDGQPPIYAVYLGKSTDPTPQIDNVTSLTLGQKFVVPPDRPDSLEGVIKAIVASVTTKEAPSSSRLTNLTNGQTSRTLAIAGDTLDTWDLALDSVVALATGPNALQWTTTWKGVSGVVTDTSSFVLDVSGPSAPIGETSIAGTNFSAVCSEGSKLQFLDSSWNAVGYFSEGAGKVGLRLTPSGTPSLPLNTAISTGASDLEKLSLSTLDQVAPGSWGRRLPLSVARLAPAVPGNQALEVRAGLDTLRASWCHPRDARDCADAAMEVRSFRAALLRWIPRSLPGSRGTFVLEGVLPGQTGNSVAASILRHGVRIGTATLVRVQDSLFRDTIRFAQGPRRPGTDTLWLVAPSATELDSLVATLVWGLSNTVLADTATIARPPLSLSLDWTGVGETVVVAVDGGQVDSRGVRTVRLSASTRSQAVVLDSAARAQVDVTTLASTGRGASVWIRGVFVDPVYGDSATDSVLVPVPRQYLRFTERTADGPAGSLGLVADLPGVGGSSIQVAVWRRGRSLGNVVLSRQPDSTFAGVVKFRQGPVRPGVDSLWLVQPGSAADSLAAVYVQSATGDTLTDTALVLRPALRLTLRSAGGTLVEATLVGGFPDIRGTRTVDVSAGSVQKVVLDPTGAGTTDILAQLSKVGGTQARVRGLFVDPVYGDTARDSLLVGVPVRTLRFTPSTVVGPRGAFHVEVVDPWTSADTRTIVVAHGRDSVLVKLTRAASGAFVADVPFAQTGFAGGDTVALGRPAAGTDSVYAFLPRFDSLPSLVDRGMVVRPAFRLELSSSPDRPQTVQIKLVGGNADVRGEAWTTLSGPVAIPSTSLLGTGSLAWGGQRDLALLLPESPEPVVIDGFFVDPVYGDTAKASLVVASPWFPARIEVLPELADPRKGDTVEIRVYDKDPDSTKVGKVKVQVGSRTLELVETGAHTGAYVLRLPAGDVDPDWKWHQPREIWRVTLVYTDPDHPRDVVSTTMRMQFQVPPPEISTYEPLRPVATRSTSGKPVLAVVSQDAGGHYPEGAQGVELKIWEKTRVLVFLYDKLGISVGHWEGVLEPKDAKTSAKYLVDWDGLDESGNPTAPGIYLIRTVLVAQDSKPLGNYVYRIGRRQ